MTIILQVVTGMKITLIVKLKIDKLTISKFKKYLKIKNDIKKVKSAQNNQ